MKLSTSARKKFRVGNKLKKVANSSRFRLSISRSSKNISAQIIDDINNKTLISASSKEKDIRELKKNKSEISLLVAEKLAKKAQEQKISKILICGLFIHLIQEVFPLNCFVRWSDNKALTCNPPTPKRQQSTLRKEHRKKKQMVKSR